LEGAEVYAGGAGADEVVDVLLEVEEVDVEVGLAEVVGGAS
jgi:hypothetical protein